MVSVSFTVVVCNFSMKYADIFIWCIVCPTICASSPAKCFANRFVGMPIPLGMGRGDIVVHVFLVVHEVLMAQYRLGSALWPLLPQFLISWSALLSSFSLLLSDLLLVSCGSDRLKFITFLAYFPPYEKIKIDMRWQCFLCVTAVLFRAHGYMPRIGSHLQAFRTRGVSDLYHFHPLNSWISEHGGRRVGSHHFNSLVCHCVRGCRLTCAEFILTPFPSVGADVIRWEGGRTSLGASSHQVVVATNL
jgi:hypothetical protein